jgi:hypothetical protein
MHKTFDNWPKPPGRIMALGSTQLLTEMSNSNLLIGIRGRRVRLTTTPPYGSWLLKNVGALKTVSIKDKK